MDLRDSAEEQQFRADLRDWLSSVLPTLPPKPHHTDWPGRREYDVHWQKLLFEAGYAGINWPTEYGG
ncbi:MAG: acyl-CoA dehydrogenase family protein, partial [Frankiaceae bacterium]|nr:acyl-CoA dehydrogenase family protein [Frankiaceae bacterium]